MRNPVKWGLPPSRKGETADAWIIIALGIMVVVMLILGDPCSDRNQPQSPRQDALCE